jgi:hypothetical protein
VRLKIEDSREGLVATISQRDDDREITGRPSIFLVGGSKEEASRGGGGTTDAATHVFTSKRSRRVSEGTAIKYDLAATRRK